MSSSFEKRPTVTLRMPLDPLRRGWFAAIVLLVVSACGQNDSVDEQAAATNGTRLDEVHEIDSASTPRPRRIILVSLDTVGARYVGGYNEDAHTPTLDQIAKDGVRFDRFYAASTYTLPATMSMLTGLDPIEHGVVNLPSRLAPEVPTLATELRKAGYATKAIVEGGFVNEKYGFDQGFSEFTRLKKKRDLVKTAIWGVLDWMRNEKDAPYFLFLHTYAAHAPYGGFDDFRDRHPELDLPDDQGIAELKAKYNREIHYPAPRNIPAELRFMCTFYNVNARANGDWLGCGGKYIWTDFNESQHFEVYREGLLEAYREGIRLGDRMVGQVRDTLIDLGQLENTLLIVVSDHGEGMFEHAIHGHDYLPYEEATKVPLVLSYPRRIRKGQIVRGLSWHLDLLPTILSFAQVAFDASLSGDDLTGVVLDAEKIPEDREIHPLLLRAPGRSHLPMRRMTLQGDFKFIEGNRHYGDPEGLLFDLKNSPGEDENLRQSKPVEFAALRELALDYDARLTPGEPVHQETGERISPFPGEVEPFELSDEDQRELESLGYIFDD